MNSRLGEWYPEHIMSYNKYRGDKTVHFLYFEDLKKVRKNHKLINLQYVRWCRDF